MEHDLYYPNDFGHKRKIYNFDPFNLLLSIATNIPVLLCGPGSHIMFIYLIKNTEKTEKIIVFYFNIILSIITPVSHDPSEIILIC